MLYICNKIFNMNKSGIYAIENIANNKKYIGSSKNIPQRLGQHKWQLRHGVHCNKHLQASFDKYGEDNFLFNPIEFCDNLIEREIYYVKLFNVLNPSIGYNKASNIIDTSGYKWSEESRKKLSNSKKGTKIHPNTLAALIHANKNRIYKKKEKVKKDKIDTRIKVLQYDIDGKFIKEYPSFASTHRDGFCIPAIRDCCYGKRNFTGGYIWKLKTSNEIEQNINVNFKKLARLKDLEQIRRNSNLKTFGELLETPEMGNQQLSINFND